MARCLVHIGMHKTGTTSIQSSLQDLDDENFFYLRMAHGANHSIPLCSIFGERPPSQKVELKRRDKGAFQDYVKGCRQDIKRSIQDANGRSLVISGEGILRLGRQELLRFKKFLTRHGYDDFEIVGYVRSPAAYLSSAVQQRVRGGTFKGFAIEGSLPAYREKFEKFDIVFGRDRVRLFKFDPAQFPGGDVVRDFCSRVGIPETSISIIRKNESISLATARLIYQYRQFAIDHDLLPIRGGIGARLNAVIGSVDDTKFRLSPAILPPLLDKIADDIAWAENRTGASLAEPLGEELATDIKSANDLLAPVPGAAAVLRVHLERNGISVAAEEDSNTLLLVGKFVAMEVFKRHNDNPDAPVGSFGRIGGVRPGGQSDRGAHKGSGNDHRHYGNRAGKGKNSPAGSRLRASASRGDGVPDGKLSASGMSRPTGTPVTTSPRPLVNPENKLIVLWSPKSACTTLYVWFSHVSGFLPQVRKYANWPHKHRQDIYERSDYYVDAVNGDLADFRVLRVIRDPYSRAVSIFRHALQTHFADKELSVYKGGSFSIDTGISFQQFLDFVATLDMTSVDIHFRPQFHPYETLRTPDSTLNISKRDLFSGINEFESVIGIPSTDFRAFDWLHGLEGKRKAKQDAMEGDALDTAPFTRYQVTKLNEFPSYSQLLTPEAKAKIEQIYKVDFDAYRDWL